MHVLTMWYRHVLGSVSRNDAFYVLGKEKALWQQIKDRWWWYQRLRFSQSIEINRLEDEAAIEITQLIVDYVMECELLEESLWTEL